MVESSGGSLVDEVARSIERSIASGEFRTDDFIGSKKELQKKYSIAAGTLNEAIRVLRSRSLVKVRSGPGGGIFVAEASPHMKFGNMLMKLQGTSSFADGALQVKDALDPAVSVDAALNRTAEDVQQLRAILHEMAHGDASPTESVQLHWRLHRRIAQISPNIVLRSLYLCLMDVLDAELVEIISQRKKIDHRMEVHVKLVDAIEAGDSWGANYWGGEQHRFPFGSRTSASGVPHSHRRPEEPGSTPAEVLRASAL